jgi:NADPH:quinone reductase-like Zn-dependent oxidoreductase
MKAILHTAYGPPDELKISDVDKPVPKDSEVLIQVRATTVTAGDCNIRDRTFITPGFKFIAKLMFGFTTPRINILGTEMAGIVEAVGSKVMRFKAGDEVYGSTGMALGGHAEYVCIKESGAIGFKLKNISFEEAAATFFAAHTAHYFLKDLGGIRASHKVLVIGASGAVGGFAVQMAKYYGAEVHGLCSTPNLEHVKNLGADRVIDYTREDFIKNGEVYDLVFDIPGRSSFKACRGSLAKKGIFLACNMDWCEVFQILWTPLFGGQKVKGGSATERVEDMLLFNRMIEEGRLKVVIDRIYDMEQIVEAFRYVETGHKKGNVVIRMPGV